MSEAIEAGRILVATQLEESRKRREARKKAPVRLPARIGETLKYIDGEGDIISLTRTALSTLEVEADGKRHLWPESELLSKAAELGLREYTEPAGRQEPTGKKRDPAEEALYQEAQKLGKEAVDLESQMRDVEVRLKQRQEENIRARKTFFNLFLNKTPITLLAAEQEEKDWQAKYAGLELVYKTKKQERDLARAKLLMHSADAEVPEESRMERGKTLEEKKVAEKLRNFRIDPEAFAQIEGMKKLTDGQKALVLENLEQITLGRIQDEAEGKVAKDIKEASWLKTKIWKMVNKQYLTASAEKMTAQTVLKGGMTAHGEILKQLVKGAGNGPDARVNEKGETEILYVSGLENLSPEQQTQVDGFNAAATRLAKIPADWGTDTATSENAEKYDAAWQEYAERRKELIYILSDTQGRSDKEVDMAIHNLHSHVLMNQYLNAHPEIEKELGKIQDQRAWAAIFKPLLNEKGIFLGSGMALRSTMIASLGMSAAVVLPVVGAYVGAVMSGFRAVEKIRKDEQKMRRGGTDAALQSMSRRFVNAKSEINTVTLVHKKTGQVLNLTEEEEAKVKEDPKWEKRIEVRREKSEITAPRTLAGKLTELIAKAEAVAADPDQEKTQKERRQIFDSLKLRLDFTNRKLKEELINFGSTREEQVANRNDLLLALSRAEVVLELYKGSYEEQAKGRKKRRASGNRWLTQKEFLKRKNKILKEKGLSDEKKKEEVESLHALRLAAYKEFERLTPLERLNTLLGKNEKRYKVGKIVYIGWEVIKGASLTAAMAWAGRAIMEGVPLEDISEWFKEKFNFFGEEAVVPAGKSGIVTGTDGISRKDGMVIPQELIRAQEHTNMAAGREYLSASPAEKAKIRTVTGLTDEQLREWGAKEKAENLAQRNQGSRGSGVDTSTQEALNRQKMASGMNYLKASPSVQAELRDVTGMSDAELRQWGKRGIASGERVAQAETAPREAPKTSVSRPTEKMAQAPQPAEPAPRGATVEPSEGVRPSRPQPVETPAPRPSGEQVARAPQAPEPQTAPARQPAEAPPTKGTTSQAEPRPPVIARPETPPSLRPVVPLEGRPVLAGLDAETVKTAENILRHLEGYKIQKDDTLSDVINKIIPAKTEGRAQKIASIYNLIQAKADALKIADPNLLKEAGLESGNVDLWREGKTFHVSKFGIAPQEIKDILEGKIVAPSGEQDLSALAERIGAEREPIIESIEPIVPEEPEIPETEPSVSPDTLQSSSGESAPGGSSESGVLSPPETWAERGGSSATASEAPEEMKNAKLTFEPERDLVLGKEYDKAAYEEFFRENPGAFTQFSNLSRQYFEYLGEGSLEEIRTLKIKSFTELGSASHLRASSDPTEARLGELMGEARKTFGKMAMPRKGEHVYAYINRIVMMSLQHPRGVTLKIPQQA